MRSLDEIRIGARASLRRIITEEQVFAFATATGDWNPLHFDEDYASKTMFKGRIVHGLITAGLISAVLGTKLPGKGTIYLEQHLRFRNPVRIGDAVTAEVEVLEIIESRRRVRLRTTCVLDDGTTVLEGEALVTVSATDAQGTPASPSRKD